MRKKISLRLFQIISIIIISVGIGYFAGRYQISARWENFRPIVDVKNQNPPTEQTLDMSLFYKVLSEINDKYYDKSKIDATKILNGAISGMLNSLEDPYTAFFPPKENESFKTQLAGEFSGIGAELTLNEQNQIAVVSPLDGSPAKAAGIKSGDAIVKVDGKSTFGWDLPKAVETIRGERGTKVMLTVVHEGEENTADIEIVRDTIKIPSVTAWFKSFECNNDSCTPKEKCSSCYDIAYIRLSQFGQKTNDEWLNKINELTPKILTSKNFRGVILDVRSNPGGILDDAVYIASEFLEKGKVVVKQEDDKGRISSLTSERRGLLMDVPVIVMTNKGSASASEILAGALRDNKRARILGETSFGKGTIQQPIEVNGGGSVHISVAKWLTPNGTWVHEKGLKPDIEVEYDATKSAELEKEELDNQIIRAIRELAR